MKEILGKQILRIKKKCLRKDLLNLKTPVENSDLAPTLTSLV
jgi:hypothetical protein